MIFFTADLHLNHSNIIHYCHRPFSSLEDMHTSLLSNWNAAVAPRDKVYILGDLAVRWDETTAQLVKQLAGEKVLIVGSHDDVSEYLALGGKAIRGFLTIPGPDSSITLCHYQMRVWPKSHYNSWHLFGHSHGRAQAYGKSMDVGVDCNNFTPVSLQRVTEVMHQKANNEDFIPVQCRRR